MASDFTDLCELIRQHCQRRGWYGSDSDYAYQVEYARRVPRWEPVSELLQRFSRAPATAEQIAQTEQVVGRELPAAFKDIYRSVADGGFGPGHGLEGVSSLTRVTHGGWQLSECAAHYLEAHPHRHLECDQLPSGLVCLCTWDRDNGDPTSMLDLNSGRAYGLGLGIRSDLNTAVLDPDHFDFERAYWIDFQAASVEDWFERWLGGLLEYPFSNQEGIEKEPPEPDEWSSEQQDEDW